MADAWLLTLAVAAAISGMGWLALAMPTHWEQVWGTRPLPPPLARGLRGLGAASLLGSLVACIAVDHPSMAVLVWFMALAVAAVSIALLLSWRPRWLGWLLPWQRR